MKPPGPPVAWAENVREVPGAAAGWLADAVTVGAGLTSTDVEAGARPDAESLTVQATVIVPLDW